MYQNFGLDEINQKQFWTAIINEFLSSFFFVFITLGYTLEQPSDVTNRSSSVLVGFTVIILVLVGTKNHGYFNPVISLALFIQGRITCLRFLVFVPAQIVGGLLGNGLLYLFLPKNIYQHMLRLNINSHIQSYGAFAIEATLTFFVVWAVSATIDPLRKIADFPRSLATGFSVASVTYYGLPLTGAALNPIRVFGLAVISNQWRHQWVFWIGPLVGSILAALVYKYVLKLENESTKDNEGTNDNRTELLKDADVFKHDTA